MTSVSQACTTHLMDQEEIALKRALIVNLARDIRRLKLVWDEQVRPTYVRWEFLLEKMPDATHTAYVACRSKLIESMHQLADPFFSMPDEFDKLLSDLGCVMTDDVLTSVAHTMGGSFKPLDLDETTRPIAEQQARLRFVETDMFYDGKLASILCTRYKQARAQQRS